MVLRIPENLDCYSLDPNDYDVWANWIVRQTYIGKRARRVLQQYALSRQHEIVCRLNGAIFAACLEAIKQKELYEKIPKKYIW